MSALLDTSVLIASLDEDEPQHEASHRRLIVATCHVYLHALAEAFSILTGGRRERRVDPSIAARLLQEAVLPHVHVVSLTPKDLSAAFAQCQSRGVRGGSVYDFLHLWAARKAGTETLVTLDLRHFQAIARTGDPRIEAP